MKRSAFPLFTAVFISLMINAPAADPTWWAARGVTNASDPSNLSPATIGQAKHMVAMALAELQPRLAAPDYQELQADVAAIVDLALPQTQVDFDNQRKVLLGGQLKALARPFYDRLRSLEATWLNNQIYQSNIRVAEPDSYPLAYSPYSWSVSTSDDSNYSPATVGQLKSAFSLRFETIGAGFSMDADADGMPDWWEILYGLNPNNVADASGDGVGDGVTNLMKYKTGRNPLVLALPDSASALALKVHTPLE